MSVEHCWVVDIGNTSTTCGYFRGKRLERVLDYPTQALATVAGSRRLCRRLASWKADRVLVASVVPSAWFNLARAAAFCRLPRPLRLGRDIQPPIPNRYRRPEQVGADRLANAVGALHRYRTSVVVIDCGTAITVDLADRRQGYLGGLIMPGIDLGLWVLAERTALLPRLAARRPSMLIGRETSESMLGGVVYGAASACRDLALCLSRRVSSPVTVVLTGGAAVLLRPYLRLPHRYDPHLSLYGVLESYRQSIVEKN